jgi:hypothetical protein
MLNVVMLSDVAPSRVVIIASLTGFKCISFFNLMIGSFAINMTNNTVRKVVKWCRDTQHNDTRHNDDQHMDIQV